VSITINTFWNGRPPPLLVRRCLASMVDVGMAVRLYTYMPEVIPALAGVQVCDASEFIPASEYFTYDRAAGAGAGSPAAFANLFRYEMLRQQGGWWLDADIYCLRPLDFVAPYVFAPEPIGRLIHNGVFKVPVESPFMCELARRAREAPRQGIAWGTTGARLCTDVLDKGFKELRRYVQPVHAFCPVHWAHIAKLVKRAAAPPSRLPAGTYAVHLFHEMWRRNYIDTNTNWPLYGWLKGQAA